MSAVKPTQKIMSSSRLPLIVFLGTALVTGNAWAQRANEGRGGDQLQSRVSGNLPPTQGEPGFSHAPRMQASSPVMRSRGDRAGKMACLQKINLPPDTAVLSVDPIGFEGGSQCRIKIMRSNGIVQVISIQVER